MPAHHLSFVDALQAASDAAQTAYREMRNALVAKGMAWALAEEEASTHATRVYDRTYDALVTA